MRRAQSPLKIERLEDRSVPADLTASLSMDGVLSIIGTRKNDEIEVRCEKDRISVDDTRIEWNGERKREVPANAVRIISIDAGAGHDRITLAPKKKKYQPIVVEAYIVAGDGNDSVIGGLGRNYIYGGAGKDTLVGGENDDVLMGDAGDDQLRGNGGDDAMNGGEGVNKLSGGAGLRDHIMGTGDFDMTLTANKLTGAGTDSFDGVEEASLTGGPRGNRLDARGFSGRLFLFGYGGDDVLLGGLGVNIVRGGEGNDFLAGGMQADFLMGEWGHDTLEGGAGDDELNGGSGNDWLWGQGGTDSLYGEYGSDVLDGGDGNDYLSGSYDRDTYRDGSGTNRYAEAVAAAGFALAPQTAQNFTHGAPAVTEGGDGTAAHFNDVTQRGTPTCFFAAALSAAAHAGYDLASAIRYLGGTSYQVSL